LASFHGDDFGLKSSAVILVEAQAELDARLAPRAVHREHFSQLSSSTVHFFLDMGFASTLKVGS
jgi:hypothetical protein